MKYYLLLTIILLSCESTVKTTRLNDRLNGFGFSVMIIDSCEYICTENDIRTLTHKGNCKYCKQRAK